MTRARTVAQKMGVKIESRAHFVNAPTAALCAIDLPNLDVVDELEGEFDYLHFFTVTQKDMRATFPTLTPHLRAGGMLWLSWPKGGRLGSDLALPKVIEIGYEFGLVESTCLRVDDTWSGLKFTHPKRGKTYQNRYGTLPDRSGPATILQGQQLHEPSPEDADRMNGFDRALGQRDHRMPQWSDEDGGPLDGASAEAGTEWRPVAVALAGEPGILGSGRRCTIEASRRSLVAELKADTTESALGLIHRYLNGLFEGRAGDVVGLYGADAQIIRYEGVARDGGIDSFVDVLAQSRRGGSLISIDRLAASEDTIAWDATIETSEGPIQTSDVFILSPDGLISRHVPRLLGYWGS